eukprot:TRINITY_DN6975_c0_g1_i5.p1 TRINITY_DN6975_c0_g1~~TRINITY_DN6975_c0_g1_i5.p1  ORF type:complete len:239 (+),score=28.95 TRINITY_DN6975_c0_g1_i5:484-1200(+)
MDNDDTIAEYAALCNGCVLSKDKDFFRYDIKFPIYSDFKICGRPFSLQLTPHPLSETVSLSTSLTTPSHPNPNSTLSAPVPRATSPTPRVLQRRLPATSREIQSIDYEHMSMLRGSPSCLTRDLGNLHGTFKKLRQALYFMKGITRAIHEKYPEWNTTTNSVIWRQEYVFSDGTYVSLLSNPRAAHKFFFLQKRPDFVSKGQWESHVLASEIVCYELCAIANNHPLLDYACQFLGGSR